MPAALCCACRLSSASCVRVCSAESAQDDDAKQQGNEFKDVLEKIRLEQQQEKKKATTQQAEPVQVEEVEIAQQNGSNGIVMVAGTEADVGVELAPR